MMQILVYYDNVVAFSFVAIFIQMQPLTKASLPVATVIVVLKAFRNLCNEA